MEECFFLSRLLKPTMDALDIFMWGGARVVIISSICSVFDEVNRGDCIGAWEQE